MFRLSRTLSKGALDLHVAKFLTRKEGKKIHAATPLVETTLPGRRPPPAPRDSDCRGKLASFELCRYFFKLPANSHVRCTMYWPGKASLDERPRVSRSNISRLYNGSTLKRSCVMTFVTLDCKRLIREKRACTRGRASRRALARTRH